MNTSFNNKFRYPRKHITGRLLSGMLNALFFVKLKRILFYPFTKTTLSSNITNVVYLNWLVPAEKIKHLIPKHIKLQQYNGNILFTVLTYKHGNFGPMFLKKINSCFGSPLQSNWRVYMDNNTDFGIKEPAIFFVKNCIDDTAYAVGSRVFSNILQTHLPHVFKHRVDEKSITTEINSGRGTAPDLYVETNRTAVWKVPAEFAAISTDREKLISLICNQDYAVADQPDKDMYAVARIQLEFDSAAIESLEVTVIKSNWLTPIIGEAPCFAFVIPSVTFTTLKEKMHKIK